MSATNQRAETEDRGTAAAPREVMAWHRDVFRRFRQAPEPRPHAVLIAGPAGIGKVAFAQALAQAHLCESPREQEGCGSCTACLWLASGLHPDFRCIEPEPVPDGEDGEKKTTISVEQVRAIADFVSLSAHRGAAKVILVQPAEALNINAANALLKSLEEPPPGTFFVLVTNRPHQLLPTIRSRCQTVSLRPPPVNQATAWLASAGVREPALALAHTGNAPLLAKSLDDSTYWNRRAAFCRYLAALDLEPLAAAEALRDCPLPDAVAWLQKWSYDMAYHAIRGTVRYNPDYREAIARAAGAAGRLRTLRFHREMVKLQRTAQHPLNTRLFLEHLLLSYRDLVQPLSTPA